MHTIITHAEQLDVQISAAMFAQQASKAESTVQGLAADVIYIDTRACAAAWFHACEREDAEFWQDGDPDRFTPDPDADDWDPNWLNRVDTSNGAWGRNEHSDKLGTGGC